MQAPGSMLNQSRPVCGQWLTEATGLPEFKECHILPKRMHLKVLPGVRVCVCVLLEGNYT